MNRSLAASLLFVALCACNVTPTQEIEPVTPPEPMLADAPAMTDLAPVVTQPELPAAPTQVSQPVEAHSEVVEALPPRDVEVNHNKDPSSGLLGVLQPDGQGLGGLKKAGKLPQIRQGEARVTGLGLMGAGSGGGGTGHGEGYGRLTGYGKVSSGGYGRGAAYSSHGVAVSGRRAVHQEAQGSETYAHYRPNAFVDPAKDRFSTFALDVDTGSYTIARRKLNEGSLPPANAVRVEEFINYFRYHDTAPATAPLAVSLEAAPSPFSAEENVQVLRVGVQARKLTASTRKPVHLTFLVDVSGSMSSADKLGLAKRSMAHLVDNLREEDTVAIATYAGRVAEILKPTTAGQRETILSAIETLQSGGSTAMSDGLALAYNLASTSVAPGHISRVVVLSDGDANVGGSDHNDMLDRIGAQVAKGVTLSTIGFGMGNYKDTMMEQLANKGNGNYYYIDDFKEAQRVFGEQLDGTLQVVAKDVKVQVEFDPDLVSSYRLIGYENRDIADKDFRNDKVDAGEVGAGHAVTALYEVRLKHAEPAAWATVRVRQKAPEADVATESKFPLKTEQVRTSVGDASGDFQFAVAVAGFAELLRRSTYASALSYDLVLEVAEPHVGKDARRQEFVRLVKKAKALEGSRTN